MSDAKNVYFDGNGGFYINAIFVGRFLSKFQNEIYFIDETMKAGRTAGIKDSVLCIRNELENLISEIKRVADLNNVHTKEGA